MLWPRTFLCFSKQWQDHCSAYHLSSIGFGTRCNIVCFLFSSFYFFSFRFTFLFSFPFVFSLFSFPPPLLGLVFWSFPFSFFFFLAYYHHHHVVAPWLLVYLAALLFCSQGAGLTGFYTVIHSSNVAFTNVDLAATALTITPGRSAINSSAEFAPDSTR